MFANQGSDEAHSIDSRIEDVCRDETDRQWREIVLIPSESICFPEVATVVGSDFGNIYAEGQPGLRLSRNSELLSFDASMFEAWHRRLSDGRFYRGCQVADRVELLAKANIAKAFSLLEGSPAEDGIHVNVQALSGAPANMGVYTALLEHGDVLMGLNLSHGGHLSHGSPFNVSGKDYRVFSYGVDEKAESHERKLDYDRIREMALQHRPRMIVGGSSAYPWDWDWPTLRAIADEVGALLLADIAHLAGMVVGGVLNNPLPYAHVVTFTTHKTLCGPRGSAIVTACRETAKAIDLAVFPGLQGGPHMNAIAGIARLFEIITQRRDDFVALQRLIVENAAHFAEALKEIGFTLEYGGTNTHLMLVDLKKFKARGGGPLDGETASRLLENVGIICNKNTLPGDKDASVSSGLRFGTPWITQRGITKDQLTELARTVHEVLAGTNTCSVYVPSGEERCRGRVPFELLLSSRKKVAAIAEALPYPSRPESARAEPNYAEVGDRVAVGVRGEKARLALDEAATCDVLSLQAGTVAHGLLMRGDGSRIDDVGIAFLDRNDTADCSPNGEDRFAVFPHREQAETVRFWIEALSDGYVELDADDPQVKVDGPLVVEAIPLSSLSSETQEPVKGLPALSDVTAAPAGCVEAAKSFFVGQKAVCEMVMAEAKPSFAYEAPDAELKKTVLHSWHKDSGAKMVPFGGWEMPVEYPDGIFVEHAAVRKAAGLFDVSHMSALEVRGPLALPFLEVALANCVSRLIDGEAQYSYMLLPEGKALDDLYVYRHNRERFMVVVNAANAERDIAWLQAVNQGEVLIDAGNPGKRAPGPAEIVVLRHAGEEARIDLAFQGPLSMDVLAELAANEGQRQLIRKSRLNDILTLEIGGIPMIAARTGYTGEEIGFELFVHPDRGVELWEILLEQGKDRGVRPAGLGARDSLRIEAGFPLFGHELEGPESLSLTEADYGFVSRYHVPFYIGRDEYMKRLRPRKKRILRLKGSGRRSVRPGQAIVDDEGNVAGVVTSFAFSDDSFNFFVLAAVRTGFRPEEGSKVRAVRAKPEQVESPVDERKVVELDVLTRFPSPEDKANWREEYGG